MASVVFRDSFGSFYGANAHQVFFAPKFAGNQSDLESDTERSKGELGEDSVTIALESIKEINVAHDMRFTVGVVAKGLGDDIFVKCSSLEDQTAYANFLTKECGLSHSVSTREASLFQVAPKTMVALLIAIIMTIGGFFAARDHEAGKDISTNRVGHRGNQQRAFAEVVKVLGPFGTLAVGGIISAALGVAVAKQRKNRYTIDVYRIE